jgi:hypothetical protein
LRAWCNLGVAVARVCGTVLDHTLLILLPIPLSG